MNNMELEDKIAETIHEMLLPYQTIDEFNDYDKLAKQILEIPEIKGAREAIKILIANEQHWWECCEEYRERYDR